MGDEYGIEQIRMLLNEFQENLSKLPKLMDNFHQKFPSGWDALEKDSLRADVRNLSIKSGRILLATEHFDWFDEGEPVQERLQDTCWEIKKLNRGLDEYATALDEQDWGRVMALSATPEISHPALDGHDALARVEDLLEEINPGFLMRLVHVKLDQLESRLVGIYELLQEIKAGGTKDEAD